MDRYLDPEIRQRRRNKLVSGKCTVCSNDAAIPWKQHQYCYDCWVIAEVYFMKELRNEK
ncbi:hypothetical protein HN784_03710 [bacterium]|nr:hypothetical protein [bacterium]MBT4251102.1 hypothetical protein [bacterium]MBT4598106.1 hypothetical protein [bacterium]MBT6753448.1 hypothetical protein [bacterium]MBT7038161.1 hypothetical protein [bacterium]